MINKRFFISITIVACAFIPLSAQETVKLLNPSFEDMPRAGGSSSAPIKGWHDCGASKFSSETPPDIHPVPANAWDVSMQPYDGTTFLGMVTRYNDTWESISQALAIPIQGGVCYNFSAYLAQSDQYRSGTARSRDVPENFTKPAVLLIWGGNFFCEKAELLGESPAVSNTDWKLYKFLLQPQRTHKYITFEAFYKTPVLEAYNGHVLVDGLSELVPVQCPLIPQDLIAEVSDPPVRIPVMSSSQGGASTIRKTNGGASSTINQGTITSGQKSFTPNLIAELIPGKVFVGQKIRIDHLYFKTDSVNLSSDSYKVLDELADYLIAYPKTVIEIGGHTNTVPPEDYCDHLSTQRAKSVQQYLISNGVPESRLKYKGYGKTDPIIKYDQYNKDARQKNQRVEIKILSLS